MNKINGKNFINSLRVVTKIVSELVIFVATRNLRLLGTIYEYKPKLVISVLRYITNELFPQDFYRVMSDETRVRQEFTHELKVSAKLSHECFQRSRGKKMKITSSIQYFSPFENYIIHTPFPHSWGNNLIITFFLRKLCTNGANSHSRTGHSPVLEYDF